MAFRTSVGEYYSILGVEPNATAESIKAAYRRLARETHPDRKVQSTESDRNASSIHMAQLNQAYAVLSDVKLRREYDDKLRIEGILSVKRAAIANANTNANGNANATKSDNSPRTGNRVLVRPRYEVDPTVVKQFLDHFRDKFLADKSFSWKQKKADGFDWALEASIWSSHYCVAARGSTVVDPATTKKLLEYAQLFISQCNRSIRKSYFLFLFPFQEMADWDSVSVLCQRFAAAENQSHSGIPAGILLLDMQHGRILQFANHIKEKRYAEILQRIATPV